MPITTQPRGQPLAPKPREPARRWFVADADGQVLGRLATRVATVLRGKHTPASRRTSTPAISSSS